MLCSISILIQSDHFWQQSPFHMAGGANTSWNMRQKGAYESYLVPELGKLGPIFGSWERKLRSPWLGSWNICELFGATLSKPKPCFELGGEASNFVVGVFFLDFYFSMQNSSAIFIIEKLTVLLLTNHLRLWWNQSIMLSENSGQLNAFFISFINFLSLYAEQLRSYFTRNAAGV